MSPFFEIARTGLTSIILHPLRSVVTVGFLVAALLPYLVGMGLTYGLEDEAETSLQAGADLYVTAQQFGRHVPIPVSALKEIRRLPGVVAVVPRIVGSMTLGAEHEKVVVVGMPPEHFPKSIVCVEGGLPEGSKLNELVVGTELARRLRLKVGALIPPFYRSAAGERLSRVVGIFRGEAGIWQANLMFCSLDTAAHLFDQQGLATDLLVYCRPNYQERIAAALSGLSFATDAGPPAWRPQVTTRAEASLLLRHGIARRQGIFTVHFLLVFIVGILGILVTSGVGLTERRREIGILKATGWQTDEILLRSASENFLLALAGVGLSVVLAFVWLRWLNGYGIAGMFLPGVDAVPGFPVPFRLAPGPVMLAGVIGLTIVMSGTLYSSWRAAVVPPVEALR